MLQMTLTNIATLLDLPSVEGDKICEGISIDSRSLQPNNLFIAIPGTRVDGHDFIHTAYQQGAAAALVSRHISSPLPQFLVPDTVLALGKLCTAWRKQFQLPTIAITGSNGKTTLKNMVASILIAASQGQEEFVLATKGTLNNHLGLPLTLAELNQQHRYAVLEMGMNHTGEIDYLTKMAQPNIAVITNAAAAHLEGLETIENIAKAKAEIFNGLSTQGFAILNRDDHFFNYWLQQIGKRRFFTFGLHADAHVTADINQNQHIQQINMRTPVGPLYLQLPLLGQHNALNALAATATALAIGIELEDIKTGLENIKPASGRLQMHYLNNEITVIDDTYNANPSSLQAAIHALSTFNGNKILVLGDMKELGKESLSLHQLAGENIRQAGIQALFTYGNLSAHATQAFGEGAYHFNEQNSLLKALSALLHKPTTVLVKGSRSMQMEKIVAGLLAIQ